MMSWFRRHQRSFFIGTVAIFLIGTFVGLGGYFFTNADYSEAVAVVAGTKIPYLQFQTRVEQYLEAMREQAKDKEISEDQIKEIKRAMLRDMVVDELLAQQANKLGLRVTDWELNLTIRNMPRFQRDGAFDQNLYFQAVRYGVKTTPEDFEAQQRKSMLASKLKQLVYNAAKLSPREVDDEFQRQLAKDPKSAEKDKDKFAANLQQSRALELINYYLRQVSSQVDIRFFLDQREQGS